MVTAEKGFWLVGLSTTDEGQKRDSVELVPNSGNTCDNIQKNSAKYAALAATGDSSGNLSGFLSPEQLSSTQQWTLAQAFGDNGVGGPICGVQDLTIAMTKTNDPEIPFSKFFFS